MENLGKILLWIVKAYLIGGFIWFGSLILVEIINSSEGVLAHILITIIIGAILMSIYESFEKNKQ